MTLSVIRDRKLGTVTIRAVSGGVHVVIEEHEGHALNFWHELGAVLATQDNEARAKAGYGRYYAHCGGLSVHGEEIPQWEHLLPKIREHWIAAFTELSATWHLAKVGRTVIRTTGGWRFKLAG